MNASSPRLDLATALLLTTAPLLWAGNAVVGRNLDVFQGSTVALGANATVGNRFYIEDGSTVTAASSAGRGAATTADGAFGDGAGSGAACGAGPTTTRGGFSAN